MEKNKKEIQKLNEEALGIAIELTKNIHTGYIYVVIGQIRELEEIYEKIKKLDN